MAEYIERKALLNALKEERKKGNFVFTSKWIKEIMDDLPTADVVPKSEADNWYQLYHSIKEELKQEKMYHRETDMLCDRYCIESQHAKRQVAREIFEEIEKLNRKPLPECKPVYIIKASELAELKKKYLEEK